MNFSSTAAAAADFVSTPFTSSTATSATSIRDHAASKCPGGSTAPFLKWVGSKRRLLPQLLPLLPAGKRLIEPFVGAGSVFLATDYEQYLLADTNPVLLSLYVELQIDPSPVTKRAQALFVEANRNQAAFNALRARFNDLATPEVERAALFLYLNKFAFNGLFRVNKKGAMNVPYAHHGKLPGFPGAALERFAHKLDLAELHCADFEQTLAQARTGDVVYCDPPYLESRNAQGEAAASFTTYSAKGFGMAEHAQLASRARQLAAQGIPVVISNHDTPVTRELYAGATLHSVQVHRSMAADTAARGKAAELVAVFGKRG
jgi:DNA adenine methylase